MPFTVAISFDEFLKNIEPPAYQRATATTRKNHLISLLETSFDIVNSFATGSLPRFTAVKEHADLDIIVVLHFGKHIKDKSPSQVLADVRKALAGWRTTLRRNGQAVTLYYKTWPNVDVVPVSYATNDDGSVSHYSVPNMHDETWIRSQPVRHSQELTSANDRFGAQFKRTIKMIKWWNRQHSSVLQSYHIEVLALRALTGTFTGYPWTIYRFFDQAVALVSSPLYHHVGLVDSYLGWQGRQDALKRLRTAQARARRAWYKTYQSNSDHKGAIAIWRTMLGDEFPAYG